MLRLPIPRPGCCNRTMPRPELRKAGAQRVNEKLPPVTPGRHRACCAMRPETREPSAELPVNGATGRPCGPIALEHAESNIPSRQKLSEWLRVPRRLPQQDAG